MARYLGRASSSVVSSSLVLLSLSNVLLVALLCSPFTLEHSGSGELDNTALFCCAVASTAESMALDDSVVPVVDERCADVALLSADTKLADN